MKKGVSVILTAWNTQDYIEECLDSVYKQSFFNKNDNYEVLLGIDGCEKTLNKVKGIISRYPGLKVFYFKENVGTYIVSNTLATFAQYSYLFRFDTDDIMLPDAIKDIYAYAEDKKFDLVLGRCKNLYSTTGKVDKCSALAPGQMLVKTETFLMFGGFRPFKCGADSEFFMRLKKFVNEDMSKIEICLRRLHSNNLTGRSETGMKSKYRKDIRAFLKYELETKLKTKTNAVIKCITAPCYEMNENGEVSKKEVENNFIPAEISDAFEEFMKLPDDKRKKYYKKDVVNTPIMMTSTGYIRKKAQSGWIGYM